MKWQYVDVVLGHQKYIPSSVKLDWKTSNYIHIKTYGAAAPTQSNYLGVFLYRFERTIISSIHLIIYGVTTMYLHNH